MLIRLTVRRGTRPSSLSLPFIPIQHYLFHMPQNASDWTDDDLFGGSSSTTKVSILSDTDFSSKISNKEPHNISVRLFDPVKTSIFRKLYNNRLRKGARESHAKFEFGGVTCHLSGSEFGHVKQLRSRLNQWVAEFRTRLKVISIRKEYVPLFKDGLKLEGITIFMPPETGAKSLALKNRLHFYNLGEATILLQRPRAMNEQDFTKLFEATLQKVNDVTSNAIVMLIEAYYKENLYGAGDWFVKGLIQRYGVSVSIQRSGRNTHTLYVTGANRTAVREAATMLRGKYHALKDSVKHLSLGPHRKSTKEWKTFTRELERIQDVTSTDISVSEAEILIRRKTDNLFLQDAYDMVEKRIAKLKGLVVSPVQNAQSSMSDIAERMFNGRIAHTLTLLIPEYHTPLIKGPGLSNINVLIETYGVNIEFDNYDSSQVTGSASDFRKIKIYGTDPEQVRQVETILNQKVARLSQKSKPCVVEVPDEYFHAFMANKGRLLHSVEDATKTRITKQEKDIYPMKSHVINKSHTLRISADNDADINLALEVLRKMIDNFDKNSVVCKLPLNITPQIQAFSIHNSHLMGIYNVLRNASAKYSDLKGVYLGFRRVDQDVVITSTRANNETNIQRMRKIALRLILRHLSPKNFYIFTHISRRVAYPLIGQNALNVLKIRDQTGAMIEFTDELTELIHEYKEKLSPFVNIIVYGPTKHALQSGVTEIRARLDTITKDSVHIPLAPVLLPLNPRVMRCLATIKYGFGLIDMQRLNPSLTITWTSDSSSPVIVVHSNDGVGRDQSLMAVKEMVCHNITSINSNIRALRIHQTHIAALLGPKAVNLQKLIDDTGCMFYMDNNNTVSVQPDRVITFGSDLTLTESSGNASDFVTFIVTGNDKSRVDLAIKTLERRLHALVSKGQ
ncbi:hypothetical protein BABINDRAFT_137865 [Babjeviella inositovora NRRL Y-12698]|uniref:K Homology domain-containing protein n=1 Tax=Babjeviella inositovora NRRL Y-12698 TaxID=984486 RepID=A0A1E3QSH6_9ASCO|nr:uncharacterized protein BABINDRAFT_137865 [Babjeviella inositovora NRRL Y-12698]ODQ79972.1 hypothetical protein BABINDRAFT_137865 [Babjeviella inositovora NRRL Y-12698]